MTSNLVRWKVSKSLQWLLRIFLVYLVLFTLFRVLTLFLFKPHDVDWNSCLQSFALGIQYDLRWISFVFLPVLIANFFPQWAPYSSAKVNAIWVTYFAIITLFLLILFGADFGQFAYVRARLNADALNFFEDPKEMWGMLKDSYPIGWILLALVVAVYIFYKAFKRLHLQVEDQNSHLHKFYFFKPWNIIFFLLMIWFVRGAFTRHTLRFDRAFKLKNNFAANLALNPMQNFFTTLRFRKPDEHYDVGKYYPTLKTLLNVGDEATAQRPFKRTSYPSSRITESKPNIVLVLCESFSMYKSSMSGNPLNATPYFHRMTQEGLFFDRCFTPHFSTARGLFALITGIPDVQMSKFSSRVPEAVEQQTIINEFTGYDKMYFIGGNADFNNFDGIINNINDVEIYQGNNFSSPKVNVWGVSDKDLFLEANKVMRSKTNPFFAIIQTADNHRPFDTYKKDTEFKPSNMTDKQVKQHGFDGVDEFNTFLYSDFCFQKFMEQARKENYYSNTIFVFVGDHGVEGDCGNLYPKAWMEQRLSEEHVPLLFYAPSLITPELRNEVVSQVDVLPTIASLAGITYSNYTLGRSLVTKNNPALAFTIYHAPGWIGVANDSLYYRYNIRSTQSELVSMRDNNILDTVKYKREMAEMKNYTLAMYEASKWLLLNNK